MKDGTAAIAHDALNAARLEEDARFDALQRAHRAFEIARDRRLALEGSSAKPPSNDPKAGMINMAAAMEIAQRTDDCLVLWARKYGIGRKIGKRWWFDPHGVRRVRNLLDKA
jgi:hypothetical protein